MAQSIKSFDCVIESEDTISVMYSLKVRFTSFVENEVRLELLKKELEKNYNVKPDNIISIEAFLDKRPKTYRYRVRIKTYTTKTK